MFLSFTAKYDCTYQEFVLGKVPDVSRRIKILNNKDLNNNRIKKVE